MSRHALALAMMALALLCTACSNSAVPPASASASPSVAGTPGVTDTPGATLEASGPKGSVTLLTHDSFALSDGVIAEFEQESGYGLRILRAGDAGAMVNQAILSRDHPLGDVLFGVDNTFLSRALNAGIFDAYQPAAASGVPAALQLDPEGRVTPVDYGDVCPVIDDAAFSSGTPPAPKTLDDLAATPYAGKLVVENPATSSPGLAFMLATVARYGEGPAGGWLDYWTRLRANGVAVSQSWDDAYDTRFSAGPGAGDRPVVVSYATDPAADVVFADPPKAKPSVSVMLDACFRQVEFAGVLAGAANPQGARAFIDFLLSPAAQADIPLQMYVFPAVSGTALPDVFKQWAQTASQPLTLDPAQIEQNREQWIQQWTSTVVR
jgi:thiamine transport system substrate-binding protein